ncbi:rho GTPase-activating protein 24-like [Anguilla rostrata]|uniref:rho GTPase-activating protein 24-like n=1 Tax=Anguilla rostrata TaxID=7938 RepID=UPI0030CD4FAE
MPENKPSPCRTNGGHLSHSAYWKIKRVLSFRRRVFGQRLEETVSHERRYGERLAPLVVEQCVAFIRNRGLLEVGLFRQPGQATLVKELQVAFDSGEKPAFDSSTDVHTVASLLKLYLRELPEPVIPFSHYQDFLMCGKGAPGGRKQALDLKKLLHKLPVANFNLLHYICRFLDEVQSYSHINRMSAQNLATVFGPNILRPKAEDPETIIEGAGLVQQLMSELIRESGSLFLRDCSAALGSNPPSRQGQSADITAETLPQTAVAPETTAVPPHGGELLRPRPRAPRPPPPAPALRSPPQDPRPPPCREEMDLRPPPRQSPSPRRVSDPLYDNCPCPVGQRCSGEPRAPPSATPPPLPGAPASVPTLLDSWDVPCWGGEAGGRGSVSSSSGGSSREETGGRNAHESTLSVYDNLDPAAPAGPQDPPAARPEAQPPPAPPEDSGDSSSWSSCEIVLEEAKHGPGPGPGFGLFPFRAEPPDLLSLAAPDLDPPASPSTMRYLVVGLKQQMAQQKEEYETQIRSLEKRNEALQGEVSSLRANLDQHRRWYKVAEIKMRNAERARADADRRNAALQQEMEQFFDTFGELNNEAKKTERIVQGF